LSQHKKNIAKKRLWFGDGRQTTMRKRTKSTYTLELLESRVLLSGDLAGAVPAAPVQPLEAPEQAVVLSVPRADGTDQQTWSVSEMLAETPSSFSAEGLDSQRDPAIASPALPDLNANLSVPEIIGQSTFANSSILQEQNRLHALLTAQNQMPQALDGPTLTVSQMLAQPVTFTTFPSTSQNQPEQSPVVTQHVVATPSNPAIPVSSPNNPALPPISQDPTGQDPVVTQPVPTIPSFPTVPTTSPNNTGTAASTINPELPRVYVDTSMPTTSRTVTVGPSGADYTDLQQALNEVSLGTTILLQPGVSYTTTNDNGFVLPNKTTGTGWIVIRPALPDSALPAPGTRLTPAEAALLPKIVRGPLNVNGMSAQAGAHHYRIIGLEFMNQGNVDTRIAGAAFIDLGSPQERSLASQSHHILFDRVYIHGPSAPQSIGVKFGIIFGGQHQGVINSTIEDITYGSDAIAVASWAGAGPFVIKNNALSSSGENIMFGGADAQIANLVPSDIEIRHNYIFKPLKWRDDPAYSTGTRKILVKNLYESKSVQRVLIDGNVFENMWPGAQAGFAINLTPRQAHQHSTQPWTVVQDLTITNNVFRNTANGIAISGQDPGEWALKFGGPAPVPTLLGGRILVKNNLLVNTGGYPGTGIVFQLANGPFDVTIQHNTVASRHPNTGGTTLKFTYGAANADYTQMERFTLQDNLFLAQNYPLFAGGGTTLAGVSLAAPSYMWTNNVFAGPWPTPVGVKSNLLPQGNGNAYPASEANIGYTNLAGRDYRLSSTSPYKNAASDGEDIGVHWDEFNEAIQ
jgi:hypothetical protein